MSKKEPPPPPDAADAALWSAAMTGVKPIPDRPKTEVKPRKPRTKDPENLFGVMLPPLDMTAAVKATASHIPKNSAAGMDHRTREKLEAGLLPIDARIDLHGLGQDEAHRHLHQFLLQAYHSGRRCVLVITGKGRTAKATAPDDWWESPRGVLKSRLATWLGVPPLKHIVLAQAPAQPKHGGSGAAYILLRRSSKI